MRLPKPKSAPGLFLWAVTGIACVMFGRIAWVVVGQNIEVVSTERGWDKFLKNHFAALLLGLAKTCFG